MAAEEEGKGKASAQCQSLRTTHLAASSCEQLTSLHLDRNVVSVASELVAVGRADVPVASAVDVGHVKGEVVVGHSVDTASVRSSGVADEGVAKVPVLVAAVQHGLEDSRSIAGLQSWPEVRCTTRRELGRDGDVTSEGKKLVRPVQGNGPCRTGLRGCGRQQSGGQDGDRGSDGETHFGKGPSRDEGKEMQNEARRGTKTKNWRKLELLEKGVGLRTAQTDSSLIPLSKHNIVMSPDHFPAAPTFRAARFLVSIDAMAHPVASCGGGTIGRGLTVSCRRPRITKAYAL